MTPREENELIAEWAGLDECRCGKEYPSDCKNEHPVRYWGNCPRHSNNGLPPDYDRDEVAVLLLPVLAQKTGDIYVTLSYPNGTTACYPLRVDVLFDSGEPTIAAAIKAAVLQLIEKEKP
jgi:hypothetical protein